MPNQFPIADMQLFSLEPTKDGMRLLRNSDHLLRRFGQLDHVAIKAGGSIEYPAHSEADEIWFVLSGKVDVILSDKRGGSPSEGTEFQLILAQDDPQGLLLPFGVASVFSSKQEASLIRLSTHSDKNK